MEGIDVDKHPGTLRIDWTSLYPGQRMKQGVDLTKYLLLRSLIPSNITFQCWWGLQGRCTPALPTAKIGRLSQAGLWESPLNFSDRVVETWLLVYCVTYSAFPHGTQREVATKEDYKGNKMCWTCCCWRRLTREMQQKCEEEKILKKKAPPDFHLPEVISKMNSLWLYVIEALNQHFHLLDCFWRLKGLSELNIIVDRKQR